jgi:hypothetical protein
VIDPGYWLATAVFWLVTLLVVLVACWAVHGIGSRRVLTREIACWLWIVGLVRAGWDLLQALGLLAFGALLWRVAERFRQRHLDDLPVMGRSRAGGSDDDE